MPPQDSLQGNQPPPAVAMVEKGLAEGTASLNRHGVLHLDAHFENILTDGRRLYFGDFGLALASAFQLSDTEQDFFRKHRSYDRAYTATHLVNWLVTALFGHAADDREGRFARVCAYARGERPTGIPKGAAAVIARHAPVAAVVSDFHSGFRDGSRLTPYPYEEINRLTEV